MVDRLRAAGLLRDPAVDAALRAVPQQRFLPTTDQERAYRDEPVRLTPTSWSVPPPILAVMLDQLRLRPGQHVLELGSGTGYTAAVLRAVVGAGGRVVTVDVDPAVAAFARANLRRTGNHDVEVRCADAMDLPRAERFDRVLVTYAVADLPPLVWRLPADARVVAPVVLRADVQKMVTWHRDRGALVGGYTGDCRFPPQMSGGGRVRRVQTLGPRADVTIVGPCRLDADALSAAVFGPGRIDVALDHLVTGHEVVGGLDAWVATHDRRACTLAGSGTAGAFETFGLTAGAGLAVFAPPPGGGPADAVARRARVRFWRGGEQLADDLVALVDAWVAAGRPASRRLRVDATEGPDTAALYDPTVIAVDATTWHCRWD
jgi:protein-L-isoaspartate(D-aspartate) O-methyltransferase